VKNGKNHIISLVHFCSQPIPPVDL